MLKPFKETWHRHPLSVIAIVIAGIVLVIFTFTRHRMTTNPRSRIITVERLVDAGTFAHVQIGDTTRFRLSKDAVVIGGKRYSSKPPNYPLLMAAQSWILKQLTGWNFYDKQVRFVAFLVLLNQVFPFILMLLMALLWAREYSDDKWTLCYFILAISFGSLAFGYAVTINNHTVSAILFFVGFYLLYQIYQNKIQHVGHYFLIGILCGYAGSIELPGLIFVVGIAIFLFRKDKRKSMLTLVGIMIPLGINVWLNYTLSGSIKPFYMQPEFYSYEGSYWTSPDVVNAIQDSKWLYTFHLLLGHHGIFSMSPVLILGLLGFGKMIKENRNGFGKVWLSIAASTLVIFVFLLSNTNNYGGWCIGTRWMILTMPLAMIPAIQIIDKWKQHLAGKVLLILMLLISMIPVAQSLWRTGFVRSWWELLWLA